MMLARLIAFALLGVAPSGAFVPRMAPRIVVRMPSSSPLASWKAASPVAARPMAARPTTMMRASPTPRATTAGALKILMLPDPIRYFLLSQTAGCMNVFWGAMALAAGLVNGACLIGAVGGAATGVSHVTGSATKAGMALAGVSGGGLPALLVLAYLGGAAGCGTMLPAAPFDMSRLGRYGYILLVCATLLGGASVAHAAGAAVAPLLLAAGSCGMMNALATTCTTCVTRPTHMTGVATDMGLIVGRGFKAFVTGAPSLLSELEDQRIRMLTTLLTFFTLGGGAAAWLAAKAPGLPPLLPALLVQAALGVLALSKATDAPVAAAPVAAAPVGGPAAVPLNNPFAQFKAA